MKNYELYTHGDLEPLIKFKSEWQFCDKETVFFHTKEGKRVFIINQITHDVELNGYHAARLYCQEKKNNY